MHIEFLLGSPRGGGGVKTPNPPPPPPRRSATEEYVEALNVNLPVWIDGYEDTKYKKKLWDWLKFKVREFTNPYSKKKKCEKEQLRQQLQESQAESISIDVLNTNDGLIRKQANIQKFIKDSFQEFFKNKDQISHEACMDYINQSKLEQLTYSEKPSCKGTLTCDEAKEELFKMSRNKTPGNDGLTAEFYETFWLVVTKFMVDSFNGADSDQCMSVSQKQGVIKLIPKANKDKLVLGNWRPITLINVDAKILSKCLAKRISKVIKKLINSQQTAFVKGRYIGEGIRQISDIIYVLCRKRRCTAVSY